MAHDKIYGICENKCLVPIYPPTDSGQAGQVWTSDGEGQGKWKDVRGELPVEEFGTLADPSIAKRNVTFESPLSVTCDVDVTSTSAYKITVSAKTSLGIYYDPDTNKLKKCIINDSSVSYITDGTQDIGGLMDDTQKATLKNMFSYLIGTRFDIREANTNSSLTSISARMKLGSWHRIYLTLKGTNASGIFTVTDFTVGNYMTVSSINYKNSGDYLKDTISANLCFGSTTYAKYAIPLKTLNDNVLPSTYALLHEL